MKGNCKTLYRRPVSTYFRRKPKRPSLSNSIMPPEDPKRLWNSMLAEWKQPKMWWGYKGPKAFLKHYAKKAYKNRRRRWKIAMKYLYGYAKIFLKLDRPITNSFGAFAAMKSAFSFRERPPPTAAAFAKAHAVVSRNLRAMLSSGGTASKRGLAWSVSRTVAAPQAKASAQRSEKHREAGVRIAAVVPAVLKAASQTSSSSVRTVSFSRNVSSAERRVASGAPVRLHAAPARPSAFWSRPRPGKPPKDPKGAAVHVPRQNVTSAKPIALPRTSRAPGKRASAKAGATGTVRSIAAKILVLRSILRGGMKAAAASSGSAPVAGKAAAAPAQNARTYIPDRKKPKIVHLKQAVGAAGLTE